MIYVIATLMIRPGNAAAVLQACHPLVTATRNEPGCMSYDVSIDLFDENRLVFLEQWENREALETHFGMPHMKRFSDDVKALLEGERVEVIEPREVEVF